MHKIESPGATQDNRFTEGDPSSGVPATELSASFMNAVQDELANVIQEAGLTLKTAGTETGDQLLVALNAMGVNTGQFQNYSSLRTYTTGEVVRGSDGQFYEFYDRDQAGTVQGIDPTESSNRPHVWMEWDGVRPGTVIEWRSGTLPEGYVENDGAAISRSDYRRIFEAFGTSHGEGDGVSTFNLPDDRGEFKRGWDHGRGVDPSRSLYSNQDHAVEYHLHALPTGTGQTLGGAWGVHDSNWQETNTGGTSINSSPAEDTYAGTYDRPVSRPTNTNWITGNWSTETRPRNKAVVYLTKI